MRRSTHAPNATCLTFNDHSSEMQNAVMTYMQDRPDLEKHASYRYAQNILANLASFNHCAIPDTVEMPCWLSTGEDACQWIAFSNGIAVDVWSYATQLAAGNPPTNYTRAVSPDLFSADFVSYPWDESASGERWEAYLERVFPEPGTALAFKQMFGLLMADTGKYEVFWQLYGKCANGKTVVWFQGRGPVSLLGLDSGGNSVS